MELQAPFHRDGCRDKAAADARPVGVLAGLSPTGGIHSTGPASVAMEISKPGACHRP